MARIEICCGDAESVVAAHHGGAKRIELCSALDEGGVTPSLGLIKYAVSLGFDAINVLIRPRGGDFVYNEPELDVMAADAEAAIRAGATGIVVGALDPDGKVDGKAVKRVLAGCGKCHVTFHRAFDLCRDPLEALEDVIELGCDCLLTSGQAQTAEDGAVMIAAIKAHALGRLDIMAGGGVTLENVTKVIASTRADVIHATMRYDRESPMRFRINGVNMGAPGKSEYQRKATSVRKVELLHILVG